MSANPKSCEILCDSQRVTGVAVRRQGKRTLVEGDYYVAAIPLERISALINERLLAIDPALGNLSTLAPNVEWMNGLQFYLRRDLPIAHGHVIHIDSEWALTSVSQVQFSGAGDAEPGDARGMGAVQALDQHRSGAVARRGFAFVVLDPDLQPSGNGSGLLTNAEPLLVNLVNTWALRPDATTRFQICFWRPIMFAPIPT